MTQGKLDLTESGTPDAPARNTQVPGQYLGFSLQVSRMLDHLLRSGPGAIVSLEVFADSGIELPGGTVVAEESKSRTSASAGNPISDRSEDFWKTIRNWVEAVQVGILDARATRFRLRLSKPFAGTIAERFATASSQGEARSAIDQARRLFFKDDKSAANDGVPASLKPHLNVIFSADRELVELIVTNFELDFGSGRSFDDLKAALDATFVPTEIADDVLNHALGWVKSSVDAQLERGEPARIAWDDFRRQITAVVRRLDRQGFLASVAKAPDAARVAEHLQLRTYVRQLTLVDLLDDDKIRAVTDFIKAEVDRVDWAAKGRVVASSFDAFEDELVAAWQNLKRRCDISHKNHPDAERGQLLYSHCYDHSTKLDGADVPEHFCRGSFHKLADARVVGWHPNFTTLLGTEAAAPGDAVAPPSDSPPRASGDGAQEPGPAPKSPSDPKRE